MSAADPTVPALKLGERSGWSLDSSRRQVFAPLFATLVPTCHTLLCKRLPLFMSFRSGGPNMAGEACAVALKLVLLCALAAALDWPRGAKGGIGQQSASLPHQASQRRLVHTRLLGQVEKLHEWLHPRMKVVCGQPHRRRRRQQSHRMTSRWRSLI